MDNKTYKGMYGRMTRNCDNCGLKNICELLESVAFKELMSRGLWITSINYCNDHEGEFGIAIEDECSNIDYLESRVGELEDDLEFKTGEVARLEELLDETNIDY